MAFLAPSPSSHSLGSDTGQTLTHSPQPVQTPFFHITGFTKNLDGKVSDVSGNLFDFAVGQQFDILILGDFNHFGGTDTGRAIQGGKGLVELQHMTADRGVLFHQIGFMTGIADVQSCLHAGNAAADNENIRVNRHLPGLKFVMITRHG